MGCERAGQAVLNEGSGAVLCAALRTALSAQGGGDKKK